MSDQTTFGPTCRHFRPAESLSNRGCGIGHPIEKIVFAANGSSRTGMAYMMPCRPGPACKAECPDYDPKTPQEIEEQKQRIRAQMDRLVQNMKWFSLRKAEMIAAAQASRKDDCPLCGAQGAMRLTVAIGNNCHMSAHCSACGEGFIE